MDTMTPIDIIPMIVGGSGAMKNNKIIDELVGEISRLERAHDLLESIYLEYGPYGDGEIPERLWFKVRNFFGFDDSE